MNSIRSRFPQSPREPMNWDQLAGLRREAWKRGILVVRLEDLADEWEKQFATNLGNRINGKA